MSDKTKIFMLTRNINTLAKICVESFFKYHDKERYTFVVGDNGSPEQDIEKFRAFCDVNGFDAKICVNQVYNFARNNNQLVAKYVMAPTDEVIVFCNDDIEFTENVMDNMIALAGQNEIKVGTVGCTLLFPNGMIQHAGQFCSMVDGNIQLGHMFYNMPHKQLNVPQRYMFIPVFGNTAGLMAVKYQTFVEVGGFNVNYKNCLEDVELNYKIGKHGLTNYCYAKGSAIHKESSTRKPLGMEGICREDWERLSSCLGRSNK